MTVARRAVSASPRARRFPARRPPQSSANAAVPPRLSLCLRDMLTQLTKSFTTGVLPADSPVMRTKRLVGQWQCRLEKISGDAQWKLHLTFPHSPSPAFATVNHYKQT